MSCYGDELRLVLTPSWLPRNYPLSLPGKAFLPRRILMLNLKINGPRLLESSFVLHVYIPIGIHIYACNILNSLHLEELSMFNSKISQLLLFK